MKGQTRRAREQRGRRDGPLRRFWARLPQLPRTIFPDPMPGKKFRFSLQKVLELRRHEVKRARLALADAQRDLERKQEQLEEARQSLADRQRDPEKKTGVRPQDLRKKEAFRERARRQVAEAETAVEDARQRVDEARSDFQEARQKKKAFEELRDKEKAMFDLEQEKAEIAFFDEQAVSRHARDDDSSLMGDL
ncbi:MAG: flagellar export protein FliJ [Bacteroidetes bacterium QH_7_62_13]|nr:MAG: flagellar export protein FliJ [Bacteroidetes bacterium QH_7_62_13]